MEGRQIRESFLRFFEERGHRRVPSSSLIPPPESGLLLTNAGMNQFIPYFLGQAQPPSPRATSVQKCFRANDIENVGHTARHLTFFEMLGNFSFGDYFKADAAKLAFELITEGYGIDGDLLWVTVYETDDEAADIWADLVGIPRERAVRRGKDDNYWWTHAAGPAGPSSEIFVDRGARYGPDGGPAVDEERFMEIWNLVFMQEEVDAEANVVRPLPAKNIDTGAGLERVAVVLQGVDNAFETDGLRSLLEVAESLSGSRHGEDERRDVSLKVMAEHGRATSMLIADGVQPSNEGRGYVLRRMLRRVATHAQRLGVERPVMVPLVERTVELMGGAYALHDTHGLNVELIEELAQDRGLSVDLDRFEELMAEQRRRAQESVRKGSVAGHVVDEVAARAGQTEFVGYEHLERDTAIAGLVAGGAAAEVAGEGDDIQVILPVTPFYAEGGGQIGDRGVIQTPSGTIRVTDTQALPGGAIVHAGRVQSGEVKVGEEAHAEVDREAREATARSHTATHVVHWTLRHLLGEHARQAGSRVSPGRLRFDFSHHAAVPPEVLEEAEYTANSRLADDDAVRAYETTMDYARSQGAIALFGEKYGDIVRVVEIGDYSRELCGGTHVPHTGKVALVRLLHESSIGSGMRRVEALVGPDALRHVNAERRLLDEVVQALGGGDPAEAPDRVRRTLERIKRLESELGRIRKGDRASVVDALAGQAQRVDGVALVVAPVPGEDANGIRELVQALRERMERDGPGAAVLGVADATGAKLAASVTKTLVDRGVTAKDLLEPAARAVGGA